MDQFAALADPNRRRILELLGISDRAAGQIASEFELSAPAVSQHLHALRKAGLVRVQVQGQRRIYSLCPEGLAAIDRWIRNVRSSWATRLDALEIALAEERKGTRR